MTQKNLFKINKDSLHVHRSEARRYFVNANETNQTRGKNVLNYGYLASDQGGSLFHEHFGLQSVGYHSIMEIQEETEMGLITET